MRVMLALMKEVEPNPVAKLVVIDDEREPIRRAETALLVRVRDHGDRDSYSELFNEFVPRLRSFAQRQGCSSALAESVVQDVMIKAWTHARLFNPQKSSARTWLYALVRNRLIDEHRAGGRRRKAYDDFGAELHEGDESASHESDHHAARLSKALGGLPEEQAKVVMMVYIEGRTHREIAELLEVPIGTVKSRVRLALQRLRKLMEKLP